MNNLAKREKLLIVAGVICILAYVYYTFFLGPALSQISNEQKNIADKNSEYINILRLKTTNVANQKVLAEVKTKYEGDVKQLPSFLRDPEIANDLNTLATNNNLSIASIGFGTDADYSATTNKTNSTTSNTTNTTSTGAASTSSSSPSNGKLKFVSVNIVINGDGNGIMNFIKSVEGVEENKRIAEVENVTLSTKSDNKNSVQASVTVSYYYNSNPNSKETINYDELIKGKTGTSSLFN